jgi:hypothetical protein
MQLRVPASSVLVFVPACNTRRVNGSTICLACVPLRRGYWQLLALVDTLKKKLLLVGSDVLDSQVGDFLPSSLSYLSRLQVTPFC